MSSNPEYAKVAEANGYDEEDIVDLVRNSFAYSFAGKRYLEDLDVFLEQRS